LILSGLLLTTACSDAKDALEAQDLIDTMTDCFPDVNDKLQQLLDLAAQFRTMGSPAPDPTGLTWSENPDGSVDVDYDVNNLGECVFTAHIVFYSPAGVAQDLSLTGTDPLSGAIDDAATELFNTFGDVTPPPFMVADWTLTISGAVTGTGSGAWTGTIRGNSDPVLNELELLRTTTGTSTVSGGEPPTAAGSIQSGGCSLSFTADLMTDTIPNQQFPIGTITFSLVGAETVTGTIDFDGSGIATITVDGVPGDFSLDLSTGDLDYNP
jgi:hypothetical protein